MAVQTRGGVAQRKVLAVKKAVQGNEGRREGLTSTAGTFRRPKVPLVFIRPLGVSINRMPMALSNTKVILSGGVSV